MELLPISISINHLVWPDDFEETYLLSNSVFNSKSI